MASFEREPIEEFDFSQIRPTRSEVTNLFETICTHPQVADFRYSLSLHEARIDVQLTETDAETNLFEELPDEVTIPYATIDTENESIVSIDIELARWFRYENEPTEDFDAVSPPTDSQLQEATAFVQAASEEISAVKNSRAIQLDEQEYGVIIAFESNTSITDTYLLSKLQEWVDFSFEGFSVSDGSFDCVIVRIETVYPFTVSDSDGLKMELIRNYEEFSIENKLIAKLPCGHSSSIKSLLVTKYEGDTVPVESTIDHDGVQLNIIDCDSIDGNHIRVNEASTGDFIPVTIKHGMVCNECNLAYIISAFTKFREEVCVPVRFNQITGYGPKNREYSFAFPPLSPIERDLFEDSNISVTADKYEWLLHAP